MKKNITIAIIPIGYADGFSRLFGNGNGHVWINNCLHSTVGNICMDMMFIDITNKKVKIKVKYKQIKCEKYFFI